MKFTLTIDPTVTETIVTVTAREVDAEVQAIQRLASGSLDSSSSPAVERPLRRLIGTGGNDATVLEVRSILAFFTKKKAVFAHTRDGDWRIKARMYELEESLPAAKRWLSLLRFPPATSSFQIQTGNLTSAENL